MDLARQKVSVKLINLRTIKKVKFRIDLDNFIARRGFRVANFNRSAMMVDLPVFVFPV